MPTGARANCGPSPASGPNQERHLPAETTEAIQLGGKGALQRADHRGAGERADQGRFWWPYGSCSKTTKSDGPSNVRGVGADRRATHEIDDMTALAGSRLVFVPRAALEGRVRPKGGKMNQVIED